ncbi:ABC transporter permease [Neobacillus vireti]|uniref:Nitrate/sulfonate/bicarbonate ABC transporter permease n=1 Tax=Neobacillus vireti LMG 21834 TaxID=1131730 RepID=A0AB94IQ96_9BACI|nr:ABC transporter permease [Neobacillus vireti]ETI69224.1 nitrate/sulfonate/bicarbonate ABC transporter permease [Neobacillus vireti LMG 21834]KLT18963.1 ABC transporter permease [Neobacillus vireti]
MQVQTTLNTQEEIETRKKEMRIRASKIKIRNLSLQIIVFIAIFGSWEFFSDKNIIDPFFFSSPSSIVKQIVEWVIEGTSQGPLYVHFVVSFEETVIAFVIGVILGVIAGYALGMNDLLAVIFGPYIQMLNALPRVVLAPIFIIWFGLGMPSKVALGVTLTFFIVFFNAFQGVREVDKNLLNNARLLGANKRQLAQHVIIPSALTWILSSLHSSFGFALVGAVVGEFIGSTKGLGFLIAQAQGAFNTTGVFAGMVLLSVTALAANWAVSKLETRFIAWRHVRQ